MRRLYILPFDHRGSFMKMFGVDSAKLTTADTAKLKDYKHIVYEGFLAALSIGVRKEDAAILVDEQFGAEIHEEARAAGMARVLTVEKSGQDEFDFEYGDAFGEHINKFQPEYVKALVRYNPRFDRETNRRQTERLKILADFCAEGGYKFLFELLAVPAEKDLEECGGKENYDGSYRWKVMISAIRELKSAGVEPDIWKLEGLDDGKQFAAVVEEALRRGSGRTLRGAKRETGVIVLGRGESGAMVRRWLEAAAGIPGVIGLAVGRTVFKQPLMDFAAGRINRSEAAEQIAKNYKGFVGIFKGNRV